LNKYIDGVAAFFTYDYIINSIKGVFITEQAVIKIVVIYNFGVIFIIYLNVMFDEWGVVCG
tara:strand:- start:274 stop:456 length:183 start_codon:yes stop_codon:yes gene_type:complete